MLHYLSKTTCSVVQVPEEAKNWSASRTCFTQSNQRRIQGGAQETRAQGPPPKRAPTMFMFLAICATCACHLVVFSEKSLFVDAINYRSAKQQYSTWRIFDIVTKQLLHLLVSWKSVRYLNLVNAMPSHVEHVSLRLYSYLVDFASALLWFAEVAYE